MKYTRTLQLAAALLGVFTLGALARRLKKDRLANGVLIGSGLLTIALVISAAVSFLRKSNGKSTTLPLQESESGDHSLTESSPRPEPRSIIIDKHLTFERRADRWILRLENVWRIQFLEIALALPPGWKDRLDALRVRPLDFRTFIAPMTRIEKLSLSLFVFSLGIYAITRLFALDQFPIYFFSDEAIQPALGTELIRDGLRYQGEWLPTYFQNGPYWNLSLSVYMHALAATLFGKSILITRATAAVMSLSGAIAIGLILKMFFKVKWWWTVVFFLTLTPAWFFHSRTAFETVMMVSFYSWFLCCYLLYRYRSPSFLFPALIFGAATLYSYSNGQAIMAVSGMLFLISDLRYHLRHWRNASLGVGLLVLLALPYIRFRLQKPEAVVSQLRILDSYWLQPISLPEKLERFLTTYSYGLSPHYWFIPNDHDLIRHLMKDYGHIALWTLPLFLIGLAICLRYVRSSAHRAVLIAALAAPFGSALANITITRALLFVVPASIFTALGLEALIAWFKSKQVQWAMALASLVVFTLLSFAMLRDALVNGPLWWHDYSLGGMQWGAKQLFDIIPDYLRRSPSTQVYLTPVWANGTDIFPRFFLRNDSRVQTFNLDWFISNYRVIDPDVVFIMTPSELTRARASPKFTDISVDRTLHYPDGTTGFYFVELRYADNVQDIFAAERKARQRPVEGQVVVQREIWQARYSMLGAGRLDDLFDGDTFTLIRFLEANPGVLEFTFPSPRPLTSLAATFGTLNMTLTVSLYADEQAKPVVYTETYRGLPPDPTVTIRFDPAPLSVSKVRIEILDLNAGDSAQIHVRELVFK